MSDDPAIDRSLAILMERICWEASEFEEDVEGESFLPDPESEDAKDRFSHFCLDIERFIGCDRASLLLPTKAERPCLLYHTNWMSVPGKGMLLDSYGQFSRSSDVPPDHKENLRLFVDGVRRAIINPDKSPPLPRFLGTKMASMAGGHMFIQPPFLLILYVAGRRSPQSDKFYNLVTGVFDGDTDVDNKRIEAFTHAIESGKQNAFYSLHYATLPSPRRMNFWTNDERSRLRPISDAITDGGHPIQTKLGRDFMEALTAHFQRQWGDRQDYQRRLAASQREIESNISHDLCRNLYYALGLLDQGQGHVETAPREEIGNVGRYLEAAEETVRACFAAPYLARWSYKGDMRPLWAKTNQPVSEKEIAALVATFDRKLIAICNAERPLRRHVEVWREYRIDGALVERSKLLDLGEPPGDWTAGSSSRSFAGWPFADRERESGIDNQGRQAMLFGPQSELIRNSIEAAARMTLHEEDDEPAAYGIHVVIDVASDGSTISGSVRNKYAYGHGWSGSEDKFLDKFTGMSDGLKAWFVDKEEIFHVAWVLHLLGNEGHDRTTRSPPH